jgi:hypothetical protein
MVTWKAFLETPGVLRQEAAQAAMKRALEGKAEKWSPMRNGARPSPFSAGE